MVLDKDLNAAAAQDPADTYALDKWLRGLGLWYGDSLEDKNPAQRRVALDQFFEISDLKAAKKLIETLQYEDLEEDEFDSVMQELLGVVNPEQRSSLLAVILAKDTGADSEVDDRRDDILDIWEEEGLTASGKLDRLDAYLRDILPPAQRRSFRESMDQAGEQKRKRRRVLEGLLGELEKRRRNTALDNALESIAGEIGDELSRPWRKILTGSTYLSENFELVSFVSETVLNPVTGTFDHTISYWRHLPWSGEGKKDSQKQYVIATRGRLSDDENGDTVPQVIPDQVWVYGDPKFTGPHNGGKDDPFDPKHQRDITRIREISKRVNEALAQQEPVQDMGKTISGGAHNENLLAKIAGGAPFLNGLDLKGGAASTLTPFFLDAYQEEGTKLEFTFDSLEEFKAFHIGYVNTAAPGGSLKDRWDEAGADIATGMGYLASRAYERDPKTGRHVFRIWTTPENPPADSDPPKPYDTVRLEYDVVEEDDGKIRVRLEKADFMGWPNECKTFKDYKDVVGFYIESSQYLARRKYPPFRDIAAKNRLLDKIRELGVPPSVDEGGEMLWIPFFGTSIEKKFDTFGDGVGGGNMFMHRETREDGTISQVAAIVGFPWEPGNGDSDFDGAQPDFLTYWDDVGVIVLDHDHFDHATLEFYASQGWLKGKKILCNERVRDIVETRIGKLNHITKDMWPQFVTYGGDEHHPDIKQIDEREFAYAVRDDRGNARLWIQCCLYGSQHSAPTDSHLISGCSSKGDFTDTYYIDNDGYGLNEHGWKFAERGQLPLAQLDEVDEEKLLAAIKDPEKLYIGLHEPTSASSGGHAPKPEEVKDVWRECLKLFPDQAVVMVPFSTNHMEYQTMKELWAEEGTLRNSTAVGANAEIRDSVMNKHGVDLFLDLRKTDIPAENVPQVAYNVALGAIKQFLDFHEKDARLKWEEKGRRGTLKSILEQDMNYRVYKYIYSQARAEIRTGTRKPDIINEYFFSGRDDVYDEVMQKLGLDPHGRDKSKVPRRMPRVVESALEYAKKELEKELKERGEDKEGDVSFWCLRSLANHGKITFNSRCNTNDYNMYQAIMAGQAKAARHATRISKTAKEEFRRNYGALGVISTGPTGSAEEQFASLRRFARGDSLFDYDEVVRSSGYKLDPEKMVLFVTQPAPPGTNGELAQEDLMQQAAHNRDVTIFCAYQNGFKIYNPKDRRLEFEQHFRKLGWEIEWDGKNNMLRVSDKPFHIHGHRFEEDLYEKLADKRLKSKLDEFIHVPGYRGYIRAKEIAARAGRAVSIAEPDDHRAYKYREDPETGAPQMHIRDYLTPSVWLIRLKRKYGLQYGGVVEMVRAVFMRRDGSKRTDGFDVRTDGDGYFAQNSAMKQYNDWLNARNGNRSSRQKMMGPSLANIQEADLGKPSSPILGGGRYFRDIAVEALH